MVTVTGWGVDLRDMYVVYGWCPYQLLLIHMASELALEEILRAAAATFFSRKHCTPSALNESYRRKTTPRAVFSRGVAAWPVFRIVMQIGGFLSTGVSFLKKHLKKHNTYTNSWKWLVSNFFSAGCSTKRMPSNFKHQETNQTLDPEFILTSTIIIQFPTVTLMHPMVLLV